MLLVGSTRSCAYFHPVCYFRFHLVRPGCVMAAHVHAVHQTTASEEEEVGGGEPEAGYGLSPGCCRPLCRTVLSPLPPVPPAVPHSSPRTLSSPQTRSRPRTHSPPRTLDRQECSRTGGRKPRVPAPCVSNQAKGWVTSAGSPFLKRQRVRAVARNPRRSPLGADVEGYAQLRVPSAFSGRSGKRVSNPQPKMAENVPPQGGCTRRLETFKNLRVPGPFSGPERWVGGSARPAPHLRGQSSDTCFRNRTFFPGKPSKSGVTQPKQPKKMQNGGGVYAQEARHFDPLLGVI